MLTPTLHGIVCMLLYFSIGRGKISMETSVNPLVWSILHCVPYNRDERWMGLMLLDANINSRAELS